MFAQVNLRALRRVLPVAVGLLFMQAATAAPKAAAPATHAKAPPTVTLDAGRFRQRPVKEMKSDREVMQYVDSVKKQQALKRAGEVSYVGKQPRNANLTRQYKKESLAKADHLVAKDSRNAWVKDYVKRADVDHARDLQVGGKDGKANMVLSDPSVNRSMGAQLNQKARRQDGSFRVDAR
jgi:hypothetical protein